MLAVNVYIFQILEYHKRLNDELYIHTFSQTKVHFTVWKLLPFVGIKTVLTHWKIEALVKYGWVFVMHTQIIGYHKWHKF